MILRDFYLKIKTFYSQSSYLQDISKVFSSNILVLVLSLISGIITARFLGVEGKGLLALLLVYPNLIISVSQMGIRQVVVYEIGRGKFNYKSIVGNTVSLFLITSLLGTVIAFVFLSFTNSPNVTLIMIILTSLTIPLTLANKYAAGIFIGKQKIGLSTVISWAPKLVEVLLLIILLIAIGMGVVGVLTATLVALLPIVFYSLKIVSNEASLKPSYDKNIMRNMLSLGFVYALAVFVNSLNYRIDIILLEKLSDTREVGLYSVGVNFAELVLQVPSAMGIVIFSRSSNAKKPKDFSNTTIKLFKYGMITSIVVGGVLCIFSSYLIPFLYSNEFRGSVPMLQLLMPGIIALVGYKIIGFDIAGKGKPWVSVLASVPGVIINVTLNFLLIPKMGGEGAAIASSFSYTIMGISHWIIFKQILKKY